MVLSRAFGAKDFKLFRKAAAFMILLDTVITPGLTIAALVFLKPILHLLDTPADIFDWAYTYAVAFIGGGFLIVLLTGTRNDAVYGKKNRSGAFKLH